MTTRFMGTLVLAALIAFGGAGCGDDDGGGGGGKPPPAKKPAAKKAAKTADKKKAAKKIEPLFTYHKVEDRVLPDERKDIRHVFRERDFAPDPSGTENRDPFRSFVIRQPGVGATEVTTVAATTNVCKNKKQLVATTLGLRDLKLIGIVSRGTRSFAMFRDNSNRGHIVRVNDCLGKEKARVKVIGSGLVILETQQEQVQGQEPRPPVEETKQLHPEELSMEASDEEELGGLPSAPSAPPPTLGGADDAPIPGPAEPSPEN